MVRSAIESYGLWLHLQLAPKQVFNKPPTERYAGIEQIWQNRLEGAYPSKSEVETWQSRTKAQSVAHDLAGLGKAQENLDYIEEVWGLGLAKGLDFWWCYWNDGQGEGAGCRYHNQDMFHGMVHGDLRALHEEALSDDGSDLQPYSQGMDAMACLLMRLMVCLALRALHQKGADAYARASPQTKKVAGRQAKIDSERLWGQYVGWENSIKPLARAPVGAAAAPARGNSDRPEALWPAPSW